MNTLNSQSAVVTSPRSVRGQGLTEYIIIVAMIAIASIVAVSYFGDSVKSSFRAMGSELTGGAQVNMVTETTAAEAASKAATTEITTLKNYRK